MIKDIHGKHYYVDVGTNKRLAEYAYAYLWTSKELYDEEFECQTVDGHYIIVSVAKCGYFRGPKYSAWEKLKRNIYKLKNTIE